MKRRGRYRGDRGHNRRDDVPIAESWKPKTILGRKVMSGEIRTIQEALRGRRKIKEPEIVDFLIPNLKEEIIPIGGTPGKGGGKKRILARKTARMHKSGRRMSSKAMVIVGNEDGVVGVHEGASVDTRESIQKALKYAKLSIIEVRRGCGSWEDVSSEPHSVPFTVTGKAGSVTVKLQPAPRGIGLATGDALKPLFRLAGIKDIWVKTRGHTKSRENLLKAALDAMKKLSEVRLQNDTWRKELPKEKESERMPAITVKEAEKMPVVKAGVKAEEEKPEVLEEKKEKKVEKKTNKINEAKEAESKAEEKKE